MADTWFVIGGAPLAPNCLPLMIRCDILRSDLRGNVSFKKANFTAVLSVDTSICLIQTHIIK